MVLISYQLPHATISYLRVLTKYGRFVVHLHYKALEACYPLWQSQIYMRGLSLSYKGVALRIGDTCSIILDLFLMDESKY